MDTMQDTKRQAKAQALIAAGAVTLKPGTGTALVRGSNGEQYTVTKTSCSCADHLARGGDCKHRIASRILCGLYRDCAKQARETGRVTIPPSLMRAIGGYRDVEAPAASVPTCRHGERAGCPVCESEAWAREDREDCLKCGAALVNGRCPAQDAQRMVA